MKIRYFGHSYLLVEGNGYSIALDPYGEIGLKIPFVKADYLFSSHSHYDHCNFSAVNASFVVQENSDNFEIIPTYHDDKQGALRGQNNVLLFTLDGVKLAFLGDYGEYDNKYLISKLNGVDILFIPIGGKYTIDSQRAKYYIEQIKPKTVIPIHYKIKGSNIDIKDVNDFLKLVNEYKIVNSPYQYNQEQGVVVVKPECEEDLWNIQETILKN